MPNPKLLNCERHALHCANGACGQLSGLFCNHFIRWRSQYMALGKWKLNLRRDFATIAEDHVPTLSSDTMIFDVGVRVLTMTFVYFVLVFRQRKLDSGKQGCRLFVLAPLSLPFKGSPLRCHVSLSCSLPQLLIPIVGDQFHGHSPLAKKKKNNNNNIRNFKIIIYSSKLSMSWFNHEVSIWQHESQLNWRLEHVWSDFSYVLVFLSFHATGYL